MCVLSAHWSLPAWDKLCYGQDWGKGALPALHAEMNPDGCGVPQKSGVAEVGACRGWHRWHLWWLSEPESLSGSSSLPLQPLQQLHLQGHCSVPCFHFGNPFLHCSASLFASWDALASILSILNMSSSLELFFFLRRLDKYLLNDNSSPVLSCHELSAVGGKEKMSYCKNDSFMPTGTKSLGCSPFPLCFSFLVLPSLGDSKTFSKCFCL